MTLFNNTGIILSVVAMATAPVPSHSLTVTLNSDLHADSAALRTVSYQTLLLQVNLLRANYNN